MHDRPPVRMIEESEHGIEIFFGILFWLLYLVVYVPLRLVWDLTLGKRR